MKKYLYLIIILLAIVIIPYLSLAQSPSLWYPTQNYLKPVSSSWGLLVPGLATSTTGCLSVGSSGWISASGVGCVTQAQIAKWATSTEDSTAIHTSGGTKIGIGTTTPRWNLSIVGNASIDDFLRTSYFIATSATASNLPYASSTALTVSGSTYLTGLGQGWLHTAGGVNALSASTSPTINYLTATSTTATSTFAGNIWVKGNQQVDGALFAPITFTAGDVSLTSLTLTNPLAVAYGGTGATSGYNNTNWDTAYTNRITSAVYPLSIASNIISTAISSSTLTASSPLTGTFAQVGTGGSLGCQTASGAQAGCLSSTDWTTFNGKQAGDATLTALAGLTISAGSLITGTGADAFSVLAGGTNGYVLAMSGSAPTWVATTTLSTISGTLDISSQSNLTCGTNCTLTGDDISVDDAFILNTGDIGTGSYTFPNASTTQLTSGTNTFYVDSNGRISAKDTTQSLTGVLSPVRHIALSTATTTAWTASTTGSYIPFMVLPFAGTVQTAECKVETNSFLGIDLYIDSTHLNYFVASSTIGKITFTSNNTFTSGQVINMAVGTTTTASGATKATCTIRVTETI